MTRADVLLLALADLIEAATTTPGDDRYRDTSLGLNNFDHNLRHSDALGLRRAILARIQHSGGLTVDPADPNSR